MQNKHDIVITMKGHNYGSCIRCGRVHEPNNRFGTNPKPTFERLCSVCGNGFTVARSTQGLPANYVWRYRKTCSAECAIEAKRRGGLKHGFQKGHPQYSKPSGEQARYGNLEHQSMIQEEAKKFEEQGYKVYVIDRTRPDILLRKGSMLLAVEVERMVPGKYPTNLTKWEGQNFFDDVVWIMKDGKKLPIGEER